jgi:hypothetical protein
MAQHEWCADHPGELEKHPGKWVAVVDEKIVAAGNTYTEVYREVRKKFPDKMPLITYVPRRGEELLIL